MPANEINKLRSATAQLRPLVHCITNPISINQCANAILAVGARPIMAEHPDEAEQITSSAHSLLLNLGSPTDARIKSITISSATAKRNKLPFVLDAVGVSCSTLRRELAKNILIHSSPSIVKGNYSEISALANSDYNSAGVDADSALSDTAVCRNAIALANEYNTVVLASGKHDIITDGKSLFYIKNGSSRLSSVTGTGCMLGALTAAYMSAAKPINAAICACAVLGICGELADSAIGIGSYMTALFDKLSTISDTEVENYLGSVK